jgi:hypothetical protein
MIRADHRKIYIWFMKVYTSVNLKLYFKKVIVEGIPDVSSDSSVLMIGNHFSWWDGFFAYYLNYRYLRKKYHVMMLEEQLESRMFLNRAGAYSVRKMSKTVIDSLNYTSLLLSDPANLVVMYPQGEIESQYSSRVRFERGLDRILRNTKGNVSILFYVATVDWFSSKRPVLRLRLTTFLPPGDISHSIIEDAFNDHLSYCMSLQNDLRG